MRGRPAPPISRTPCLYLFSTGGSGDNFAAVSIALNDTIQLPILI
jgi:hypothetical protein